MVPESVVVRAAAVAVVGVPAAASLIVAVASTPSTVRRFEDPCPDDLCAVFERPSGETLAMLSHLNVTVTGWAIGMTFLCWASLGIGLAVAAILTRHTPSRLLAVVTSLLALTTGVAPFVREDARAWLLLLINALVVMFLGLFPTGTWRPAWLRWVWPAVAAVFVVRGVLGGVVDAGSPVVTGLLDLAYVVFLVGIPVHRFWRAADWIERQQMKWPLIGVMALAGNQVLVVAAAVGGWLGTAQAVVIVVDYGAIAMILLGVMLALLRHRLLEVDVLVRRATAYTVALVAGAGTYVAVVVGASLVVSSSLASAIGAVVTGLLAVICGLVAMRMRVWLRRRLLGSRATPGATAAVLARTLSPDDDQSSNLAGTIAGVLSTSYVAVTDAAGEVISVHGTVPSEVHTIPVDAGGAVPVGSLVVAAPEGRRTLNRGDRAVLTEVLPFIVLVLRAQLEAAHLREARADAATSREDERRRMRADLHDGVGPLLASQLLALDELRADAVGGAGPPPEHVDHLEGVTRDAIAEVRRIAHDLRPAALDAYGLDGALRAEADRFAVSGLPVDLELDLNGATLSAAVEVAVLRIVQEALTNTARHAGAGHARVRIGLEGTFVSVIVADDGRGCGDAAPGHGRESMRRRAQELGGELTVRPGDDGRGTVVTGRIPL